MKYTTMKLGQILVNSGVLSQQTLEKALSEQKGTTKRLGEILIENKHITERQLIDSLSHQLDIPYLDLDGMTVDETIAAIIPETMARINSLIPVRLEGNVLTVAIADPLDYNVIRNVEVYTGHMANVVIAEKKKILDQIHQAYTSQKAFDAARELSKDAEEDELEEFPEESDEPIIRFVNNMIDQAVILKASDIHIEPQEKALRIRFRIDGKLTVYMETGADLIAPVVSRIKFISNMNIAEKRVPQDGRISYKSAGKDVDLRISVLPSVFGEKVVIRITTALGLEMTKEGIGFLPENLEKFNSLIKNPHGIILVCGPTGSGKTTTLYTALREIKREDINIVTVENPVEMIIEGITQVEVNAKAGLTFAAALRSILRQDPDVVMVGEIRDPETAEIAISAAITGHVVFSTLHTFDAPSAIIRPLDMGVVPYMVSSSVAGVISQRLVRKLCPVCKEAYEAMESDRKLLGLSEDQTVALYRPAGCEKCHFTGYQGRTAVHEVMMVNHGIRHIINQSKGADEIREEALKSGMQTLEDNVRRLVLEGNTSISEYVELLSFNA